MRLALSFLAADEHGGIHQQEICALWQFVLKRFPANPDGYRHLREHNPVMEFASTMSILYPAIQCIMKTVLTLLIVLVTSLASAQKKILIYTHNGKGYKHENIAASVETLKKICKGIGYDSEATDDPGVFTAEKLKGVSCIIFSNSNNEAFDTEAQKQVFVDFIRNGGGFVGIHSASGSERQWPWFAAMLGGRFVRHPELQKFTIKVVDRHNPATEFLDDTWNWEDECYYVNQLNPDIHVLLAADLTTVKDDKRSEYPGVTFGDYFPLSWCHEFDGGRQFYTALGHKAEYYSDPHFVKHLTGGIRWVLKKV